MEIHLRYNKVYYLIILFNLFLTSKGQVQSNFTKDSVKSDVIYSNISASIDYEFRKNKPIVLYSFEKEKTILTEEGINSNQMSMSYSDFFSDDVKLTANLLIPKKNGKYQNKQIKDFYKNNIATTGIFYEDFYRQTCVYPNLKIGYKTNLKFSSTINDPVLTPIFFFNYEVEASQLLLTVRIPNYLKVKITFVGDSAGITHTITKIDNSAIHTYSCINRPAICFEDKAQNYTYYTPHLIIIPISYTYNDTVYNLAGSVSNLFNRYNKNIKEIPLSNNNELYKLTDSLILNCTDTIAKINAIYNWVQNNIKYVAFEEGNGGFVPRPAEKIVTNKYGDCKDKANLLVTMLNRAKINCYYTWVGSRGKPYNYEDCPSPYSDDHMIVAMRNKGNWIFLDATSQFTEFGFPSSFIQGKEALIRLSDTSYVVKIVPIIDAKNSIRSDSIKIHINNNFVYGSGKRYVSGYIKENYKAVISNSKNPNEVVKDRITLGNNKLQITKFNLYNGNANEINPNFEFTLPNYLQVFNNEMYLNLNLIKDYNNDLIKIEDRKLDLTEDYKYTISQNIQLDIPEGKFIDQTPKNHFFSNDDFSFEIKYTHDSKKIILNKTVVLNHILLKKNNFSEWNSMIEKLSKAYSEVVIIKNK